MCIVYDKLLKPRQSFRITLYIISLQFTPAALIAPTYFLYSRNQWRKSSLRITIRRTRKKEEGVPKSTKNRGHDQGSGNRRIRWAGKIPKFTFRDGGKPREASVRAVDHRPEIGICELLTRSEISFSSVNGWSRSIPCCFIFPTSHHAGVISHCYIY